MAASALLPAYLIVGADEYKRSRAIERMKARLEKSGMAEFNLDERDMTRDPAIDDIIASLNTFPMGSDFRLVILDGCDRLPKAVSEPLVEYFADPSPTTVCLVVANTLAKNTRLYKAIAKIDKKAVVDCTPKKAWEMPKQVVSMARAHGKTIGLPAAEALVSRAGEQSRMLDNELKRLSQMVEGPEITLADVERLVMRTAEVKPWDFLNAVSARDLPRALELLALQPDRSEVRLFSLLVTRLRELITAKALDARGTGRELASVLGVQSWQVKNHLTWARRFKMSELIDALSDAVEVESALKGSADSALALQLWVTKICTRG
ncbi:DNA polymerase III subunit delta [Collinsella tanakaei]|uniref:DNA polymerase III subunit delta n=1 Tax=Collinsella tanakaei TaxID=626935 RepID=UPI0019572389|nr:DNA polymerase III subunit delta [Collinsella tanakaei]MBM6779146.1 DNA polymerase III subunit delta [Collinsella tanakaei]